MLTDDSTNPRMMPTRANMVRWLCLSFAYYYLILFLLSWKQCNGLWTVLRRTILSFSTVKPALYITWAFLIVILVRFGARWSDQRSRRRWSWRFRRRFYFVRMINCHKLTLVMFCSYLSCKSLAMQYWCPIYVDTITGGFPGKWSYCRRCKCCLCDLCQSNPHFKLMHEIMVRPLPPGCRLTAIFDVSLQTCLSDIYWFWK